MRWMIPLLAGTILLGSAPAAHAAPFAFARLSLGYQSNLAIGIDEVDDKLSDETVQNVVLDAEVSVLGVIGVIGQLRWENFKREDDFFDDEEARKVEVTQYPLDLGVRWSLLDLSIVRGFIDAGLKFSSADSAMDLSESDDPKEDARNEALGYFAGVGADVDLLERLVLRAGVRYNSLKLDFDEGDFKTSVQSTWRGWFGLDIMLTDFVGVMAQADWDKIEVDVERNGETDQEGAKQSFDQSQWRWMAGLVVAF